MAEILVSPGIAISEVDKSSVVVRPIVAGAALIGPTVKGKVQIPTVVTSYSEYLREFGSTFVSSDGIQREFLTSMAAKYWFESNPNESLLVVRVASPAAFTSATSTIVSGGLQFQTLSVGQMLNNGASESGSATSYVSGSGSKDNVYVQIVDVDTDSNTFSVVVRRGDDSDKDPIVLETFANVSLDPTSTSYIASVIGDQKAQITSGTVDYTGNYANKSAYIRVANVGSISQSITTGSFGFESASGVVGTCYSGSTPMPSASADYFENISSSSAYPQSVAVTDYETAIDLLENTDEYQFSIVSAPGLLSTTQVGKLVSLAESRGDCIAVIDLAGCADTVDNAASAASAVNSSYAATYFPWLQMYSATGKLEWVPASVAIPGVYSANDAAAAPWYVPAGMTRGVVNAVQARKKLVKTQRDTLYKKNVNPIAVLPPVGLVAYGQKTLQKKASALDRVNVRRLLIELKRRIREMAAGILFEQNTAALQNGFKSQVEAYLSDVVRRNGLYNYSVDMSGNTPEAIDRNEFHCAIVLQPAKAVEYIYLSFTVTSTGVDFE